MLVGQLHYTDQLLHKLHYSVLCALYSVLVAGGSMCANQLFFNNNGSCGSFTLVVYIP